MLHNLDLIHIPASAMFYYLVPCSATAGDIYKRDVHSWAAQLAGLFHITCYRVLLHLFILSGLSCVNCQREPGLVPGIPVMSSRDN